MADLKELLERAQNYTMTDAEIEAQRQSWVRAFAPCEHGYSDFETCPHCRALPNPPTQKD